MILRDMIEHLAYLDRKASILDRRTKEAKAKAAEYEWQVHQRMQDEGYDLGDGTTFAGTKWTRAVTWYAAIQDPLEFATWAEEHAPHLIQPKPRAALLNQLVQQHKDDGTPLPPGIGASPRFYVGRHST